MKSESFWNAVFSHCKRDLLFKSRIHSLSSFGKIDCQVFVKREDESGFGISGCKKRKYASLIPYLKARNFDQVNLIGGVNSNHIAGFSQLLVEENIPFHLFLKQPYGNTLSGNRLLTHLLVKQKQITWIESKDWAQVESITEKSSSNNSQHFLIPEGGSCLPALPGALTLMHDILRNEKDLGEGFDHIFIDSGTALIAGGLVLMNHFLQRKTKIHVVLMADDEKYFANRLNLFSQWFQDLFNQNLPPKPSFSHYFPITGKSFGNVNATVLKETRRIALEEGIITDPVYTTKLFMTARDVISQQSLKGKVLIIHSGGGTGLMGFGERIKNQQT